MRHAPAPHPPPGLLGAPGGIRHAGRDVVAAGAIALAAAARFEAALLAGPTATAVLERWCAGHGSGEPPRIVARRLAEPERLPSLEQRERLRVGAGDAVRHRRVRLAIGDKALSEADNWYVASRLTLDMNAALEDGDAPFGRVVAPLAPTRRTLAMTSPRAVPLEGEGLHPPPRERAERRPAEPAMPAVIFALRALVLDGAGRPIAEVDERYLAAVLDFAAAPWATT